MISVGFSRDMARSACDVLAFFTGNNGQGFPSIILWLAAGVLSVLWGEYLYATENMKDIC